MNFLDRQGLCDAAVYSLSQTSNHRRLAFLWAAVNAAAGMLTTLVGLFLSNRIAGTGGLEGMGTRNALSTLQLALFFFTSVALPFWNIGYHAAALDISRNHKAQLTNLAEGFRRFGPVMRFFLLQGVVYIALLLVSSNINSLLLSMTPLYASLMETMLPVLDGSAAAVTDPQAVQAATDAMMSAMLPIIATNALIFLVLYIPVSYRLRMVPFLLMEDPQCGALYAMVTSARMMRHNCFALFLLDLRFWWFYTAEALIALLCYGDLLLPLLGVQLPFSQTLASFLFYAIAVVLHILLYTFAKNRVSVTYAKAYDTLAPQG